MFPILSLLGGKTIGKYIAIGLAAVAVVSFIYTGWNSYNNAIAKAASVEIKLHEANQETAEANANIEELANEINAQQEQSAQTIRRIQRLARLRAKRANDTSATLARLFNTMDNGDAIAQLNRMLSVQVRRINGESNEGSNPKASDNLASQTSSPDAFTPFACIDKETATVMLHNLTVLADYVEDVEALKVSYKQPHEPLNKGKSGE